jgi:serine/threonine protein kinase
LFHNEGRIEESVIVPEIIKVTTKTGKQVEFYNQIRGNGTMKDCYFSPDGTYVVLMYRNPQPQEAIDRLENITGKYQQSIFFQAGGNYWKDLLCWPTDMLELNGKVGIVAPIYHKHFFFQHGSTNNDMLGIQGKEKEGKWFASAKLQNKFLDLRERGDWLSYLSLCIKIARGVRRLHAAGLAHSDLSYKNILVDPTTRNALIIDLDGLVVPGKYPPDVAGTPDFIAPEVIATMHLPRTDPARKLPSIATDRHALAVLIYMYLLYRHPLKGDKNHDPDPAKDDQLAMGERALFIEHPTDLSNRIKLANVAPAELPWKDTAKIPFKVAGPYLSELFQRAFITGLHAPEQRPTADEWEYALVKTADLIQRCENQACVQKWFAFDNTTAPKCPFCGTDYRKPLPVLDLYFKPGSGSYRQENHRLMVYPDQSLYPWHVNRTIFPNEKLDDSLRKRVGYFQFHEGSWYLTNEGMKELKDVTDENHKKPIPPGSWTRLFSNQKLLFDLPPSGRLAFVSIVNP